MGEVCALLVVFDLVFNSRPNMAYDFSHPFVEKGIEIAQKNEFQLNK